MKQWPTRCYVRAYVLNSLQHGTNGPKRSCGKRAGTPFARVKCSTAALTCPE
jgi:hypothetical protein